MNEVVNNWFSKRISDISDKIIKGEKLSSEDTMLVLYYMATEGVKSEVKDAIRNAENRIMDNINKLNENYAKLRDDLNSTKAELSQKIDEKTTKLDQKVDEKFNILDKKIDEKTTKLDEKIDSVKSELSQQIKAVDAKVDEKFNILDKKIDEKTTKLDEKINQKFTELDKKIDEKFNILDKKIDEKTTKLDERINAVDKKVDNIHKELQATRMDIGGIAEELYVNKVISYLERRNEKIINVDRQVMTKSGKEIDAVLESENKIYAVEVKMKVETNDVDKIKKKAEELSTTSTKEVIPVITGAKITNKIKDYAKNQGVLVV